MFVVKNLPFVTNNTDNMDKINTVQFYNIFAHTSLNWTTQELNDVSTLL